jgi:hydroxysqualene dehydroxylase
VIVATTSVEAGRLCQSIAPPWAERALALQHEPIATVYVQAPGIRLPHPMAQLPCDDQRPAQFVLDHGHWGGPKGQLALVVSGAGPWLAQGQDALTAAAMRQLTEALGQHLQSPLAPLRTLVDKRATFRCTAGLQRPSRQIAPGLQAAGDYVAGPYPATLEGAMQSGVNAAQQLQVRWPPGSS